MEFSSDDHQNPLNNNNHIEDANNPPHSNPLPPQPSNDTSSPNPPPQETSPPPPSPPQVAAGGYQSFQDYPPPPPPLPPQEEHNYYFGPENNMPQETFIAGHIHETNNNNVVNISEDGGDEGELGDLASKPTFKIVCKASGDRYNVAIRNGIVMLTKPDPTDLTQQWIKDERFGTKVKDAEGNPCFSLVNKGTGHAVKHSYSGHPVQLIPFRPILDVAILWTESKDFGDGYRTIRMINNIKLVLDAFNGDSDHGGVHVGTVVALYECWKGDNQNQQWKLLPF